MVPSSFEAFSLDAAGGGFVLFEQVEGDAGNQREVLRAVACAFAAQVFAKLTSSAQCSFDAPVLTNDCGSTAPRRAAGW